MRLVRSRADLDAYLRAAPHGVLVPTMGALHAGHASLIAAAADLADRRGFTGGCMVSIFVNPTQFGDPTDLARYPRTLEADTQLCAAHGAACVFAPGVETIYPPDDRPAAPPLPPQATAPGLEDRLRPGHFAGVCQVVLRLFDLVRPHAAIFGEKDWQQLQVIGAMTRALALPIDIIPGPTVRGPDGLALSSRNRFLADEDRARALGVSRALRAGCEAGTPDAAALAMVCELAKVAATPEYAVVRDALTLQAPDPARPMRALIAARFGSVRLIDNCPFPEGL